MLKGRALDDNVIAFGDDLSWGPIGDERLEERIAYFNREDPFMPSGGDWSFLRDSHADFWRDAAQPADERIVWLGSRCASEIAAYLAYLDKFSDLPAVVVRPDDYLPPHPRYGPAGAIGVLDHEQIGHCLDHAERRPVSADQALFARWSELVDENAMLRVVTDQGLVSAPIDAHDHFILAAVKPDWVRHVRVVGHALGNAFEAQTWVNSQLLFNRLFHLVDSGVLEADGDVRAWTDEPRRSDARIRLAQR